MQPPLNTKTYELPTSTVWFDENGILFSRSKKSPQRSLEETKKTVEDFKKIIGGKKVCMLIDTTYSNPASKEVREYAAGEFPKMAKAVAFISDSPLGKMIANVFFTLKKQPFPVKMFNDEKEAVNWLKQFLNND